MRPALIPALQYDDAPAALDFLCNAFGFERHAVYADQTNPHIIHHAQLVFEGNMIMLNSTQRDAASAAAAALYGWRTAREAGGVTMSIYAVIADPDAHHTRAVAGGADIIRPPHDNDGHPGRGYETRDLEGNVWSFGSYDPWATA